jgi:hypothetical protein
MTNQRLWDCCAGRAFRASQSLMLTAPAPGAIN